MFKDLNGGHALLAIPIFGVGVLVGFLMKVGANVNGAPAAQPSPAPSPTTTVKGPVDIVGVKVGQPLTLPKCDPKQFDIIVDANDAWDGYYKGKIQCYVQFAIPKKYEALRTKRTDELSTREEYRIKNPYGVAPSYINSIDVFTLNGVVAYIDMETNGGDGQSSAYYDLVQKFGPATTSKTDTLQNGFGARFESINASWTLNPQDIVIAFRGIGRNRDHGEISVTTGAYQKAMDAVDARQPTPHL